MIVDTKVLDKLKHFSLNSYQAKLWTALLSRGVATAGELSDISNVPRSRAYDVLESLEKKGFIIMKIGKPIKYIAVPPAEVIKRVKKHVEREALEETQKIESLRGSQVLEDLQELYTNGVEKVDPTELSASIRGRNNLYNHLAELIDGAQESVIIATTSDGLIRKADALQRTLDKAHKRGVAIKIAAPISKESTDAADLLKNYGEVRDAELNSRFIIADNKMITFMLTDDSKLNASYDVGVHVKSPFFVQSISTLFNEKWKNMRQI